MTSLSDLKFGDFTVLCKYTALPFCKAFEIQQNCSMYPATGNTGIKDLGEIIASFIAFLGTLIIAYRTHTKYAAVGRTEMNLMNLFYGLLLMTGIIIQVLSSPVYVIQAASVYGGLVVGFFWILFLNGFVGYQVIEDGSHLSIWGILLSTTLFSFLGGYFTYGIAVGGTALFGSAKTESQSLFGILLVWPLISIILYSLLMTFLVIKQLSQRKPIIYLFVSVILVTLSFVFTISLHDSICVSTPKLSGSGGTTGYVTGAPFGVFIGFLGYCALYKFWFAITEGTFN